jgi:hypothetical protein
VGNVKAFQINRFDISAFGFHMDSKNGRLIFGHHLINQNEKGHGANFITLWFGNLIGLPFQGRAAKNGHTLF